MHSVMAACLQQLIWKSSGWALLVAVGIAAPPRSATEAVLSAYDSVPSRQDLTRLGGGVDSVLLEIAADPKANLLVRMRAVGALGFFPSKRSRRALGEIIRANSPGEPGPQVMLLRAALTGLAVGFGDIKAIRPYLEHGNSDVRIGAALALSRVAKARSVLLERQSLESHPRVQAALRRALKRIERAKE